MNELTKQEIYDRAEIYLLKEYKDHTLVPLIDSIQEYEFCSSISYCIEKEKHFPSSKRTIFCGGGPILVSKVSNHVEITGSNPSIDWIEEFELKIRNLEIYHVIEISFAKTKISLIKTFLNYTTNELIKQVNSASKIVFEADLYDLTILKNNLKDANVDCEIFRRERAI